MALTMSDLPPEVCVRFLDIPRSPECLSSSNRTNGKWQLLRYIMSLVDSPTYSDKERQTDLTSFSLVSRSFRAPAQSILYSRPVIRNAGRAFILHRTLSSPLSSTLSTLVRAFSFRASTFQDNADPGVSTLILQQTNPVEITLGSRLFDAAHGDESVDELRKVLLEKVDVESFSFGFHQASNIHGRIYNFLSRWTELKKLTLSHFDLQLAYPGLASPTPPPPSYALESLTLLDCYIKPLPPLSLSWVLGSTTHHLRTLILSSVTFNAVSSDLFPLLPAHLVNLTHLTLHNLTWVAPRGTPNPAALYPCRANSILPVCLALHSLSLEDTFYDKTMDTVFEDLPIPKTLKDLEVVGKTLFWKIGVTTLVKGGNGAPLQSVVLVGPTVVTTGVKEVLAACKEKGILARTRFAP
ncbi:hypothetical protein P7C70_g5637, partial [Phenoliferia sp. Uapishka_3]